tara:strand:+ start:4815 stop:4955 length:141 start_codon:yes stop_codon:yes gene_type:complete
MQNIELKRFLCNFEIKNNVVRKNVSAFYAATDEFRKGAKLSGRFGF